ncbi:ATP-binding protein [Bradyrhizobium iriomotense]|uniref:ATP-binding protein n=1 Tax=Bradyrhizobium iriomotense TaxID=441950 RepID=UPI0024E122CC|nr:winged helix-turn-helix domain-containing protein [Bradyrhizobium iriomotense]
MNVAERSLRKAEEIVPVGGRAFDILMALIDRAGEVVTKGELMARAWPDVIVEEGSLRVHLSALRKALGDGQFGNKYISNVQGRGYCFVASVTRPPERQDGLAAFSGVSNLPPALGRMVGRDDAVREICARMQTERLVTVLGTGGIGKTTIAVAVGHAALADFSEAVSFVDLSALKDKEQVFGAVIAALGVNPRFDDPEEALLRILRDRKALIILDGCEHLVDKAAEITDRIFRSTRNVHVLATSREALQVAGEGVFHLVPLDCPPEQEGQTATQVLSYSAARLFAERMSARGSDFSLSDGEAPVVAEICRRLDGIALAIELAAGRAATFGVRDTLSRLGSRLDLLKFGRRTANPRHQTLRATLDWSHDQLSEVERIVLRRVGIFVGHFTLEAAVAVAEGDGVGRASVVDAVGTLVDKSLIGVLADTRGTSYRLLDTTRAYTLEKLATCGEHNSVAARHADYSIGLLEANSVNLFDLRASETATQAVRDYLGNVRAALEWSFGPNGNDRTSLRLAAAAAQLFVAMSLLPECRHWMERATDRMTPDCDQREQMEIHASLALSLMFTEGNSQQVRDAFETALTFAEQREDAYQTMRLLSGLSMYFHRIIDAAGSLELALRSEVVARKTRNPDDAILADSMLGSAYYMLADHFRAQQHLERSLRSSPRHRRFNATQYLFDPRTTSLFNLTRSHWFAGNLDRAARCAEMTVEEADRSDHPIALCRALMLTMPYYFWIDDVDQVKRSLSRFELTAEKYSLAPFRAVALGLRGRYLVRIGETGDGIQHLWDSLEGLARQRYEMLVTDFVSELAVCLAKRNERVEALKLLDESIAVQITSKRPLHLPALLMAKGLTHACGRAPDVQQAEHCLQKAMDLADQQSALSFQLRAGLELARIWIGRGDIRRAGDLIKPIYDRFSEGFATPDLKSARGMLELTSVQ